ncbi:glycoside hydrolase/deacetylase [Clavulina sp. PMI_390]|nr:glycoside hydrolase/deacetylase [Clavulina sp. PMI_390]
MRSTLLAAVVGASSVAVVGALQPPTPVFAERDNFDGSSPWHHPAGHHIERLFRRDTAASPTFGSPGAAGSPVYPSGDDPTSATICSATYECQAKGDIWDAPAGTVALSFDDGPLAPSPTLYAFLKSKGVHATHFFIGGNVRANPDIFLQAYQNNSDPIAVHTYTHPYMTIQSNEAVLAELGWTMQIIYDSTGGRVPKFWRDGFYVDVDMRVRAIAKEVFGLTTVIWNQDSADWELTYGEIPLSTVEASLKSFYSLPKTPGLIILEHELSDNSVNAFMNSWQYLEAGGWKPISIPDAANATTGTGAGYTGWYQNAQDDTQQLTSMSFGTGPNTATGGGSSTTSASGSATTPSGNGSGSSTTGKPSSQTSTSSTAPTSTTSKSSAPSTRSLGWGAGLLGVVGMLFVQFA